MRSAVAPIFSGGMTIWPDGEPIRLVRREPSDADWLMLRSMSPDMAQAVEVALQRPGLMTVATDQENADALERIRGSFGAMSLGQLLAEARQLKPLALDGVKPDVDELAAGRYKLSRTLYVVWNRQPGPKIEGFLGFLRTEQATSLLTSLGHIPLSGTGA
jgi:phosphate transport system substrate-binding protein